MKNKILSILNEEKSPKTNALLRSIAFIVTFIISLVLGSMLLMMLPKTIPQLYYGVFGTIGALLTALLFVRMEKISFSSIGLRWNRRTVSRFVTGSAIGIALFLVVMGFVCLFGGASITPNADINTTRLLIGLLPVLPLALMEEIGFRTYPLLKLEKAFGVWPAQVIIAFCFAVYHMLNGWGIALSFMGPFIWAFVFGLSVLRTRGIAMATGIHFALNIMQHLMGFKKDDSLFNVVYADNANQYVGIAAHVLVLIGVCVATQWFVRSGRR